jgi:hypothetical protein
MTGRKMMLGTTGWSMIWKTFRKNSFSGTLPSLLSLRRVRKTL